MIITEGGSVSYMLSVIEFTLLVQSLKASMKQMNLHLSQDKSVVNISSVFVGEIKWKVVL